MRLGWGEAAAGRDLAAAGRGRDDGLGIGFTVALFVSSLSFPTGGELEPVAKIGILTGSIVAAILGTAFLAARYAIGPESLDTSGGTFNTPRSGALSPRTKGAG